MSVHTVHVPTRDEVVAAYSKPVPKSIGTASIVLAAIGLVAFVIGLFVAPDRVWRAYHVNWLFFASLSSGRETRSTSVSFMSFRRSSPPGCASSRASPKSCRT